MNVRRNGIYFNGYDDESGWYNGDDGGFVAYDEYVMDGNVDVCSSASCFVGPARC